MTREEIQEIREIEFKDCRLCESEEFCDKASVAYCKTKRRLAKEESEEIRFIKEQESEVNRCQEK